MDDIRQYLLSVILTAVICSLLPDLLPDGGPRMVLKTVCGIVLTAAVLSPLGDLSLELPCDLASIRESAARAAAEGEKLAGEATADGIAARAEAYILDKAALKDPDIRVELKLEKNPPYRPVAAAVSGVVTPEGRSTLEKILATEFEIPKEALTWNP